MGSIDSFIHKLAGALALMSMINITGTFTSTGVRAHPDARVDVARARPSRPSLGVSCGGEGRPGDAMVRMKVTMKRAGMTVPHPKVRVFSAPSDLGQTTASDDAPRRSATLSLTHDALDTQTTPVSPELVTRTTSARA